MVKSPDVGRVKEPWVKSPEGGQGGAKLSNLRRARDLGLNSDKGGKVWKIFHRLTDNKTVVQNLARRTAKPLWKYFHHGGRIDKILPKLKTATL